LITLLAQFAAGVAEIVNCRLHSRLGLDDIALASLNTTFASLNLPI
jgi:hypothetical protein